MESKAVKHLAIINKNDEYGTPPLLFLEACGKYNCTPKVDYFASDVNHVCDKYYTKSDDAFSKSWTENGFINSPYSMIGKVMQKAYEEHMANNIELMILAYAKTDTRWWHEYVMEAHEIRFLKGRLRFGDAVNSAPFPSAIAVFDGRNGL